jgi:hypothetical protein
MRRLLAQVIIVAVTAFAIGVGYRYLWNDPSQANVANYIRSGVHGMGLIGSPPIFQLAPKRAVAKMANFGRHCLKSSGHGDGGFSDRGWLAGNAL